MRRSSQTAQLSRASGWRRASCALRRASSDVRCCMPLAPALDWFNHPLPHCTGWDACGPAMQGGGRRICAACTCASTVLSIVYPVINRSLKP